MLHKNITKWIKNYTVSANFNHLVVGISGGIDSSVVSTLCAETNIPTTVVTMPIRQKLYQNDLSLKHAQWLSKRYKNVKHQVIDLNSVFDAFESLFNKNNNLALANSRSRLRMVTLYQIATSNNGLVVGTGNKVEDFGVGFYTKYGDGGVDISPIGDCLKTEVWSMGKHLGILQEIIDAPPTDGLWDDDRNDEDQLGMSYQELEQAMEDYDNNIINTNVEKFLEIQKKNLHKMVPIPIYKK